MRKFDIKKVLTINEFYVIVSLSYNVLLCFTKYFNYNIIYSKVNPNNKIHKFNRKIKGAFAKQLISYRAKALFYIP